MSVPWSGMTINLTAGTYGGINGVIYLQKQAHIPIIVPHIRAWMQRLFLSNDKGYFYLDFK
jgi:hypothetical protein